MATAAKKPRKKTSALATREAEEREFRKTNEAIGLRVKEGRLTLLIRKLFNVMIFHAQEQKEPGRNAPIETATSKKYFWVPLAEVARDARYDSKDMQFLKDTLNEMQGIRVLMENERQWTSEQLVASVTIVNPAGLNFRGGQLWFGFAFPPEVHELVMSPGTYTRLSIFYQNVLRSGSALALYEVCRRYATNPSHLSNVDSIEHWYGVLTGNPVTADLDVPYKYFKRDVIKPAIAEVNSLTDIRVELIEHKSGRRITALQFRVELAAQAPLAFPAAPLIDMELIERVMKFGFSQAESADFVAAHGDQKVRSCAEFVEARMAQTNSAPLDSPAAYFRWSLREGAAAARNLQIEAAKTPPKSKAQNAPQRESLLDRFLTARADEALAVYRELEDDERRSVLDKFLQHAPAGLPKGKGAEHPMVRALLGRWYAGQLWGEPTAEHLGRFAERFEIREAA